MDGRVCVPCLPVEHMTPGCTMGRRQAGGGSVMLWAIFCWETLGPAIHVDVTHLPKHGCRPCISFHGKCMAVASFSRIMHRATKQK